MSFSDLGLLPELLRAVADKGYDTPSPIQREAIPAVLQGRDILAGAQTGTGKTAGFVLPILQRLSAEPAASRAPRALVLAPTRELAAQVAQSARDYGKYTRLKTYQVFGGVSINPQISALRAGCDILVATPGRLLDLVSQRELDLSKIQVLVLDEADRMLDMGFINDIRKIIKMLPQARQNLLFSATYSDDIRGLAERLLRNPLSIQVAPRNAPIELVEQRAYRVHKDQKRHLLVHLIKEGQWRQVLIFTRTKHGANRLTQQIQGAGIEAAAIHGNKSQAARVKALDMFKRGEITALVATEVAARGLDIKELPQVVNYELPNVPEDYVHRIGRTGRAGAAGEAISLVSSDETSFLRDIERLLRRSIPVVATPEFKIVESAAPPAGSSHASRPQGGGSHGRFQHGQRQGHGRGHSGPRRDGNAHAGSNAQGSTSAHGNSNARIDSQARQEGQPHAQGASRPQGQARQRGEGRPGQGRPGVGQQARSGGGGAYRGNQQRGGNR
jgi:ATP-dependent RNA helicase RhlE